MSFDRIAPVYDALSRLVFGRALQQAQTVFLPHIAPQATVLIIGGGTGSLLPDVLSHCQPARVLFLEASEQMLNQARRRIQHHALANRVEFRHGTQADLRADEQFTVLMLPFVLDLFSADTLKHQFLPPLMRAVLPGGVWIVTDFINSPRRIHRFTLSFMYLFFRLISGIEAHQLPDWQREFRDAGLSPIRQQTAAGGQVESSWWAASPK